MDEHERQVTKVADWLADGWDWDSIGAALGMGTDEVAQEYAAEAAAYIRRMEQEAAQERSS